MKVVVYSHHLELGGSQTNAIDLAGAVRDLGHEVIVFAINGPAAHLVENKRLQLVQAPDAKRHPSLKTIRALCELTRSTDADIVHAYEWPACLNAYYGSLLVQDRPLIFTVLSMGVPHWLPGSPPLIMGSEELVDSMRQQRKGRVELCEPPIDTDHDGPHIDPAEFLRENDLDSKRTNLVIVSRLAESLKLEGISRSIDAVGRVAREKEIRLVIVGGGPAAATLRAQADEVNHQLGSDVIVLTGPMVDPRPAYAAADVVLAMGSSALRALAFAKPLIVLGEKGYSAPFNQDNCREFLYRGFYGLGDGDLGSDLLAEQILAAIEDANQMQSVGAFGRQLVVDRYGLKNAAARLEKLYGEAIVDRSSRGHELAGAVRPSAHLAFSELVPEPVKRRMIQLAPRSILRRARQPWDDAPR